MKSPTILRPAPNVLSESLNDEIVLLDMRTGHYFGLSPVAARIWSALQESTPLEKILLIILEEFDTDPVTAERDMTALVQSLMEKGLLEANEPDRAA